MQASLRQSAVLAKSRCLSRKTLTIHKQNGIKKRPDLQTLTTDPKSNDKLLETPNTVHGHKCCSSPTLDACRPRDSQYIEYARMRYSHTHVTIPRGCCTTESCPPTTSTVVVVVVVKVAKYPSGHPTGSDQTPTPPFLASQTLKMALKLKPKCRPQGPQSNRHARCLLFWVLWKLQARKFRSP